MVEYKLNNQVTYCCNREGGGKAFYKIKITTKDILFDGLIGSAALGEITKMQGVEVYITILAEQFGDKRETD